MQRFPAIVSTLIGSITLAGHIFGIDVLTRLHPRFFPMRAGVSLALILLGLALVPTAEPPSRRRRTLAVAVFAIGMLGLMFRYLLWAGTFGGLGASLQMSSLTAVSLLCCSAAVVLMDDRKRAPDRTTAALLLSCLAAFICGLSLIGDVAPLPRVGSAFSARMAIHTAVALALISVGMAWSIWRTLVRETAAAVRLAILVLAGGVAICLVVWRMVLANRADFAIAEASSRNQSVAQLFNQHVQARAENLAAFAGLARRAAFDLNLLSAAGIVVLDTSRSSTAYSAVCSTPSAAGAIANLAVQARQSAWPIVGYVDCGASGPLVLWLAFVRPGTVLLKRQPFRSILGNAIAPVAGNSYSFVFRPLHGATIALRAGRQPFADNALVDTEVNLAGLTGTLRMYLDPESVRGGLSWIADLLMICGLAGAFTLAMGVYFGVAADLRYRSVLAAQSALTRQAQQLLVSNANLQQFAYVASHDLQEPLRIIATYSQLLRRRFGEKLAPDGDRFLGFLETASARMSSLIRDLLAYSRVVNAGDVPAGSVDMNLVVNMALDNLSVAIQESGARVNVQGSLPSVCGYQVHLVQVMQNLISNALKYRTERPPEIDIGAARNGESWDFRVCDNGIGIKPEYHERIFGIFRRLHSAAVPGTGIGLALCKTIVEQHGGAIWLESELGSGSTFFFRLPADKHCNR